MSITLELSAEQEAELMRYAVAAGTDVSGLLVNLIHEILEERSEESADDVSYEQWQRDFRAWIAMQRSRNPSFDDSRERIYN